MEKSSETKELILNIATKLFAAKGYEAVGVQEICTESKITKPTLYYYFGSKTGLLSAIIESKGKDFLNTLQFASIYIWDFLGSFKLFLYSIFVFVYVNSVFYRLLCTLISFFLFFFKFPTRSQISKSTKAVA